MVGCLDARELCCWNSRFLPNLTGQARYSCDLRPAVRRRLAFRVRCCCAKAQGYEMRELQELNTQYRERRHHHTPALWCARMLEIRAELATILDWFAGAKPKKSST